MILNCHLGKPMLFQQDSSDGHRPKVGRERVVYYRAIARDQPPVGARCGHVAVLSFTVVLVLIIGCDSVNSQDATSATSTALEPPPLSREDILRSMPTNADKNCVGISLVAEALLDGALIDGSGGEEVEEIAQRIYASLTTAQPLRYHRHVMIDGVRVSIDSQMAITKLSTLVADLYKRDYLRLIQTEEGRQKLLTAQDSFVATSHELDRILDADPDKVDAFLGTGIRKFPDGTIEDTHHAFLISQGADGGLVVYDANDPGLPISCRVRGDDRGVTIEWTCKYKATGKTTTQQYFVVPKDRFFRMLHKD